MAQPVERQVVGDPLAANPNANASARQLGQMNIRNPNQTGGTDWIEGQNAVQQAVSKFAAGLAKKADQAKDDAFTEGKLKHMQGVTQTTLAQSGDKYEMQGWQAMESATSANDFVLAEELRVGEEDYQLSPDEYRTQLLARRAEKLNGLPDDPVSRKMWVDQFDNTADGLIAKQAIKHNEYNKVKTEEALSNQLITTSKTDMNTGRVMPGSDLRVSPGIVSTPLKVSNYDRDAGIRTLLGEAGNEGENGMAAVAHVLKNRATRKGFGGKTIAEVALAEKQFSTWNADIATAQKFIPGTAKWKRAERVFDAVMAGNVADMTGGADHYYSPSGMKAYQAMGIATSGDVPKWARGKGVSAKLGGHLFFNLSGGGVTAGPDERTQGTVELAPFSNPSDVANLVNRDDFRAPPPQPTAQDLLLNNPTVPARRKGEIAAQLMVDQLKQGDDTLYQELGGDATLRKLGLPETEITKVGLAYGTYKQNKANEFSVGFEKQKDEVMQAVKRGDVTPEEAGEWLTQQVADNRLTEDNARSLQQQYFTAAREGDDKFIESPELQAELAQLQINLSARDGEEGFMTLEEGLAHARVMAKKYGIPEKKMEGVTQQLVNEAQQRVESIRSEIRANGEKRKKDVASANAANAAIAAGYGLNDLNGTLDITLDDGTQKEISVKQFGINSIKQSIMQQAQSMVGRGGNPGTMSMEQASVWADRQIHVELNKHHVVDEDQRRLVTSALNGGVIGTDGKVTEDAQQAMDWYLTIANDPRLGSVYASQYVDSVEAKAMANTVSEMMTGGLELQDAIYKAHARLTTSPVSDPSGNKDFVSRQIINTRVGEAMDLITEDAGGSLRSWTNWVFGTRTLTPAQQEVVNTQRSVVGNRIEQRARMLKSLSPQITETVAIQGAIDETAKDAVHIGGEIVFDKEPTTGKDLSKLMGFNGDKVAPNDALNYYIEKHYDSLFTGDVGKAIKANADGTWWEDTARIAGGVVDTVQGATEVALGQATFNAKIIGAGIDNLNTANTAFSEQKLPYYTKVDMRAGLIQISFYKPKTGETLLTKVVKLPAIGQEYRNDKLNQPTLFGTITKKIKNVLTSDENGPMEYKR